MNGIQGTSASRRPAATRRVAVVGAGPGGLAAAMLLAREGVEVTVYEKERRVGGRTATLESGGYRFDVGPTFFLYPQMLQSIFERCGLDLRHFVELRRVDPGYRLSFEDGPELRIGSRLEELEREIARIDPVDATQVRRFVDANRRKFAAFAPVLQRSFSGLGAYLSPAVLSAFRHLFPLSSVDAELRRYFRDPRVRLAFSFQTKYLGMSPFRCPNLFTFLPFLEYEYGVWHPVGGCGAVSTGMARAARLLGVDIRLGEAVEALEFSGRRATGVRTRDRVESCDAAIINADFAGAVTQLVPAALRRRWSTPRVAAMNYSCSTFMLYLGLDGRCDLDHHTIYLARDYERNIAQIEAGERPPTEPSIYVANPGRTDSSFARDGRASLYVLVPVGHCGAVDWSAEKQRFRDAVLARLEGLGIPGLRNRIRFEQIRTPDDWRDRHSIYRGATFNLAHGLDQMLYFRPHNRLQDVERVYLVGGGTHPGSGLPVIYGGARITADLLLGDLGLGARVRARNQAAPVSSAAFVPVSALRPQDAESMAPGPR